MRSATRSIPTPGRCAPTSTPRSCADYVREWMPGLDAATAVPISCTYTSTEDEAFVLDRVGRIVVGAGFSGQGFKFAPGVGAVLADLALDPEARAAGRSACADASGPSLPVPECPGP